MEEIFGEEYWLLPTNPNLPSLDKSMTKQTSERDHKSHEAYGRPLLGNM